MKYSSPDSNWKLSSPNLQPYLRLGGIFSLLSIFLKADRFEPNSFKKGLFFGLVMQNGFITGFHKAKQCEITWKIALINTGLDLIKQKEEECCD